MAPVEVVISQSQLNEIITSHRELHEVIIKLSDVVQGPSRSVRYQSFPRRELHNVDLTNENAKPDELKIGNLDTKLDSSSSSSTAVPQYSLIENHVDANDGRGHLLPNSRIGSLLPQLQQPSFKVREVTPLRNFEIENWRARKEYRRKQEQSKVLHAHMKSSYLVAEYDFQYKLFPDQMYYDLKSLSQVAGLDPWAWTKQAPDPSDGDAYNAYHQLSHGQRLQESVLYRRSELMEALFPLRTSHILQSMSWPELEYSYGLHLKDIIHRCGFAKQDNAIGYVDSDVTLIVIEIGRYFRELDYSSRPENFQKGTLPDAVGPFVKENWSEETRKRFTLQELYQRCHSKGLIKDWEGNQMLKVVSSSIQGEKGTGTTDRQAEMLYILENIFSINKSRRRDRPLRRPIQKGESEEFILDFLRRFDIPDWEDGLKHTRDQVFASQDLNLKTLKHLGGLRIVWTDCVKDHLRLSIASRTITLFWDVSLLDQSLLFWYNIPFLNNMGDNLDTSHLHRESAQVSHVLYELRTTYRLLFHNMEANQFTTSEICAVTKTKDNIGIRVHDLRVDLRNNRARKILKHLLNAPLPRKIARNKYNNSSADTISSIIASGPPYPLDLCWHLENILTPYPQLVGENDTMRSFSHFPRFGNRLRELKYYMDNQKPTGWYQMWKDKRDRA